MVQGMACKRNAGQDRPGCVALLLCSARGSDPTSGGLKVGDGVNLERAMGAHVRFGGHFVQASHPSANLDLHR